MGCYSGPNRIFAFSVRTLVGFDLEAHFLPQCSAKESAYAVGLPFGSGHKVLQLGAFPPLQQFQDNRRLTAVAGCRNRGGPFRRPASLRSNSPRPFATIRGKALDSCPDAVHGNLPAGELSHRAYARQAVPDFDQAGGGPSCCQLSQFFHVPEAFGFRVILCLAAEARAVMLSSLSIVKIVILSSLLSRVIPCSRHSSLGWRPQAS